MNIAITTRGYKAPDKLKNYVQEKADRLSRFDDIIMDSEAKISYEKLDQVVEFNVKLKHKVIRVREKSEDIFKSVDLAIDNLERQVAKAKDKMKAFDKRKIVENLIE
jgi:putative sigma-54 modulation protein